MGKVIDLKAVADNLDYKEIVGEELVTEVKAEVKPVGRIVQAHISYKIAPKGTYSSVEVGKVVEINTLDRDIVNGIVGQLKEEVLEDTIEAARLMVIRAKEEGML